MTYKNVVGSQDIGVREGIQFIRVPNERPTSTRVLSEMSWQEKC